MYVVLYYSCVEALLVIDCGNLCFLLVYSSNYLRENNCQVCTSRLV